MNLFSKSLILLVVLISFQHIIAQTYPQLAGTWYINGQADAPCLITQSQQYLNFSYSSNQSKGYFTQSGQIYASDWNAYANLSADGNTITWNNQNWTRYPTMNYGDIGGTWYVNGDQANVASISQTGKNLEFKFSNGSSAGYWYSSNQIFATAWNTYANVSSDLQTITWGNQTWTRKPNNSKPSDRTQENKLYCRFELSTFYYASQLLGSAWGRSATEPAFPTPIGISAMQAHLRTALDVFKDYENCLNYDLFKLRKLESELRTMSSATISKEIEMIIKELQTAINRAAFKCDNGVQPIALFVAGVHLGAAQAWASAQQCMPVPMPAPVASVISAHLNTASTALAPYAPCLDATRADKSKVAAFNFNNFSNVPLTSLNSIEAHTFIVGTETQLLWAIALSDCCCSCSTGNSPNNTGSACDATCQEYCKQRGYREGKFNGKTVCLLGVVSDGNERGCDCK